MATRESIAFDEACDRLDEGDVALDELEECPGTLRLSQHLRAALAWADLHEIDLSEVNIMPAYRCLELAFHHSSQSHGNVMKLKKATGGLEAKGEPPHVYLQATVQFGATRLRIVYYGALACEVSYICRPEPFKDGTVSTGALPPVHAGSKSVKAG